MTTHTSESVDAPPGAPRGDEALLREILLTKDPCRLQSLLTSHCTSFDAQAAKVLKEHIDQVNRAEPRHALALAEAGVSAATICSNDRARAWMLWAQAHAHMQLENYKAGVACCDAAVQIFESTYNVLTAAQVQVSRLFALVNLGQEEQVIQLAGAIRKDLERYDDQYALARLDMNVGIAYDDTDRHEEALAHFKAAAARFEVLNEPLEVLRACINVAVALEYLDRYDEALQVYVDIRPKLVELDKPMVLARNDFNMGVLYFWLGDYTLALRKLEEAHLAFQHLGVLAEMDQVDLYRAMLYLELNQFNSVIETCGAIEKRARERGIIRDVVLARRFSALARGYRQWPGDWKAAVETLEHARDQAESRQATIQVAQINLDIALLLLEAGLPQQALPLAEQAVFYFEEQKLLAKQIRARIVYGRCSLKLGQLERAGDQFHQALALVEDFPLAQLAFRCHYGLGQVAEEQHRPEHALHHYALAIKGIDRLRERILVDDFRASFFEDKLQVYADAVRLCLAGGDLDRAFSYMEQAKARVLLDLILACAPSSKAESDAAVTIREQLRVLEQRWSALQSHQLPDPRESEGQDRALNADAASAQRWHELTGLEQQIITLRRELQVLNPIRARITGESVLSLSDLQKNLADDVTALEYFAVDHHIVVLVIEKDRCHVENLKVHPDTITYAVRELLTDLQAYQPKWDVSINKRLRSLYDDLIKPIRPLLNTQRLILIPHGSLFYVPFSALCDGKHMLLEHFECAYAPSATVGALCEGRETQGIRNVIMAFSGEGRIPGTLEEAARISGILPDTMTLCEHAATLENLRHYCRQANILHLATHGYFRNDNPLFSTLQLADVDLTLNQVYDLPLQASLVTLSACESGLNQLRGNDLMGLAGAFLYAGAASLVVSLWHVQDASTAHLMQIFYQHLARGQRKAAALRAAQMALLNSGEFAAPFYWAPFMLFGDTGVMN